MFAHAESLYSTSEGPIHLERAGEKVFVSHAHSDHIPPLRKTSLLLSSNATLDFLKAKGKNIKSHASFLKGDGFEISLLNAGHMLGSTQFHAEKDGQTFTYTGDFNLLDSLTSKGAVVTAADVLLIESTYGSPEYVFPNRQVSYENLASWASKRLTKGESVLLGGYSTGKAQEIIAALNSYASISPLTTSSITASNEVYKKHGVKLDFLPIEGQEAQTALNHAFGAVVPLSQLTPNLALSLEQAYSRKVCFAPVTGWTLNSGNGFCLSDHADFPQLIEYVERANPKTVYCCNGFSEKLALELRKKGFNALALKNS